MSDESLNQRRILEAANELAGLKAYNPETAWTFEELKAVIANILAKHFPE